MARISKTYGILISALLALLGFSCGNGVQGYELGGAYGTPSATYKVKGIVVSEADDSPIKGILVELKEIYDKYYEDYDYEDYIIDTASTNGEGSFILKSRAFPGQKLYVELTDIDGEENGSFAGKKIEADFTDKTFTGGDGNWYDGEAELDLGIIKMKPE